MSSRHVPRIEAETYLVQLQACFVVWLDTMTALEHASRNEMAVSTVIAAIGPLYRAHRELAQLTITPPMEAVQRAAMGLLHAAMEALDAVAAGQSSPAVRDMNEQLTIFQTELVRFAALAGFPCDC